MTNFVWCPTLTQRKLFEEWKSYAVGLLVSSKDGIRVHEFKIEIRDHVNETVPLETMGFPTINHFLYEMGKSIEVRQWFNAETKRAELLVFISEFHVPQNMRHIRDMVNRQAKPKKVKRDKRRRPIKLTKRNSRLVHPTELLRQVKRGPPKPFPPPAKLKCMKDYHIQSASSTTSRDPSHQAKNMMPQVKKTPIVSRSTASVSRYPNSHEDDISYGGSSQEEDVESIPMSPEFLADYCYFYYNYYNYYCDIALFPPFKVDETSSKKPAKPHVLPQSRNTAAAVEAFARSLRPAGQAKSQPISADMPKNQSFSKPSLPVKQLQTLPKVMIEPQRARVQAQVALVNVPIFKPSLVSTLCPRHSVDSISSFDNNERVKFSKDVKNSAAACTPPKVLTESQRDRVQAHIAPVKLPILHPSLVGTVCPRHSLDSLFSFDKNEQKVKFFKDLKIPATACTPPKVLPRIPVKVTLNLNTFMDYYMGKSATA